MTGPGDGEGTRDGGRDGRRDGRREGSPKGGKDPTVRISSGLAYDPRKRPAPWAGVLQPLEEEVETERKAPRLGLRLTLTALIVLGLFTVMVGRLWTLQVLQAPQFKKAEINTATRTVEVAPIRGLIFARGGQMLVGNQVIPVVTLSQLAAQTDPQVIPRLALVLGMKVPEVQAQITNDQYSVYTPIPIAANVPMGTIVYISEHKSLFPGVGVAFTAERTYPAGSLDAQTLGYVGDINASEYAALKKEGYLPTDQIGQDGVEAAFQQYLRGRPGSQTLLVDPQGDVLKTLSSVSPKPGDAVVLNIDYGLQQQLDKDLATQILALRHGTSTQPAVPAPSGAAVVLDPRNGDVLAMSSFPTYDPSVWVGGISESEYKKLTSKAAGEPLLNRPIDGLWTPGSTFKLISATAALDTGLISPYTRYDDTGVYTLCPSGPGCTFTDNPGDIPLGPIDVSTALTVSSDVFFYNVGVNLYNENTRSARDAIARMANDYGYGEPTGINLPGESAGLVDNPSLYQDYAPGDALEAAFGQGMTEVTPLQLANAYATFANGGTRYVPQIAAEVVGPNGHVVKSFGPVVAGHVPLPPSTYNAILTGLEGVVRSGTTPVGTAYSTFQGFPLSRFPIAGKTGTATVGNLQPTGLFVGFGPVGAPRYVVAVIIDQAGYGASTAAPVARQIFDYLLKHPVRGPVVPKNPVG